MFKAFVPSITLPAGKSDIRKGGGIGIICNGQTMLFDGFEGGEPTNGMKAWLAENDVSTVDVAVLSHVHYDHYHGLLEIEEDERFHIKQVLMYDPLTLKHGCDGSANGRAVKDDMNNAYKFIRAMQAHGTKVNWLDKGGVVKCGDTSWKVYRNQPRKFTHLDDGNAYAFVNDGSLVLYSPEVQLLFGGDGCIDLKDAIAYFKAAIIAMYVQHHGNDCPESSARAAANAGVILMWETNVERNGAGTTGFTMYGSRRVVQAGIPVWMQNEPIYITAANGKIVFKQGGKIVTASVPYQSYQAGWNKDSKGWFYVLSDGRRAKGWIKVGWSKPQSKDGKDWFFMDNEGYMVNGFHKCSWSGGIDTFYFDENGVMQYGWKYINGKWYFFDKNGAMKTGWLYDNGSWFYLGADGKMVTGWVTYKGRKCYLEPKSDKNHVQGTCYVNRTAVIDGKSYKFDKDGYAEEIVVSGGGKAELNGCDVASYQAGIDFAKMTTTDFAIIKGTQGTWYVNPYADIQYGGAKAAGKLLGMYHYAEGKDPIAEARYFVRKVGSRVGECILAIDWEGHDNSKFNSDAEVAWVLKFAMEVYRLTKVHIFLYMSKSVTRRRNWAEVAKDVRLWCAQYANQEHTDYKTNPWTDNGGFGAWKSDTIRQYSSKGRVAGYGKDLDINMAYMSKAEWMAAAAGKNTVVAEKPKTQWSAYVSMTTSPVKISNSGSDENGNYKNGKAGDQTGKEWRIRDWYSYPWNCVLRHPLAEVRACLDTMAVKAAENDNIGYDQLQRDDYGIELAKNDYDPSKIKKPVESDCSKGVIDNTKGTGHTLGIPELQNIKATYTGNMRAAYKAAGFYVLTESKYLTSSDYLLAGDILLNDKHHTCTVITNGSKSGDTIVMPLVKKGSTGAAVEQLQEMLIAQGYSCGKWGADGDFGNDTLQAVKSYQRDHGLEVDGEVGPITWAALIEGSK